MKKTGRNNRDMLGRSDTASLQEALLLMRQNLGPPTPRKTAVLLEEALDRICAVDILSPENLPAFPRSTMDGYAVRARDTYGASEKIPSYLEVTGEVAMGEFPRHAPLPGACFRIATGGILPPETDAVVMLEHTVAIDAGMIEVVQPAAAGAHVITAGEDVSQGELLFSAGHRFRPQDLGLLAGVGIKTVSVFPRVRVGIISTGDEVVPHDQSPLPGKIRDMNSISLTAQVKQAHAEPTFYGIAADREKTLANLVQEAKNENDIVLLSGSSSVGTRDLGETVFEKMGPPGIIVHGVSVKPGKPVIIARAGDTMLFGLPGHPVSAAVSFDLFVRPAITHLSGAIPDIFPRHRRVKAMLKRNLNSAAGRTDLVRVEVRKTGSEELAAHPMLGKSGALSSMVRAHGYIVIAEELQGLKEGEMVEVRLFD
jgi:molybdopterin molybdotransferase